VGAPACGLTHPRSEVGATAQPLAGAAPSTGPRARVVKITLSVRQNTAPLSITLARFCRHRVSSRLPPALYVFRGSCQPHSLHCLRPKIKLCDRPVGAACPDSGHLQNHQAKVLLCGGSSVWTDPSALRSWSDGATSSWRSTVYRPAG